MRFSILQPMAEELALKSQPMVGKLKAQISNQVFKNSKVCPCHPVRNYFEVHE
jgi:hypothetical protein